MNKKLPVIIAFLMFTIMLPFCLSAKAADPLSAPLISGESIDINTIQVSWTEMN